ncbi:hypothetical protein NC651_027942 [Populus alba x Populus x berolinensis]|nr:hypothetical protein NC651_027938 [Populus alba x Populus x berolinensis]KAJ6881234.1 hypothetical protein NC651_027942 [Populus alba x Populus x berolinensis]
MEFEGSCPQLDAVGLVVLKGLLSFSINKGEPLFIWSVLYLQVFDRNLDGNQGKVIITRSNGALMTLHTHIYCFSRPKKSFLIIQEFLSTFPVYLVGNVNYQCIFLKYFFLL